MRLVILFLTVFSLQKCYSQGSNPGGTYYVADSEWGGHRLTLKKNGKFIEAISGCVYDIQTKGKWRINGDTIKLQESKRVDLRTHRRLKTGRVIGRLIVKSDSLFQINGQEPSNTFNLYSCLVRKNK